MPARSDTTDSKNGSVEKRNDRLDGASRPRLSRTNLVVDAHRLPRPAPDPGLHKTSPLDGLIVTKLDGSGKGGIAVTIYDQLKIPPRFIGTGEEPEAFSRFEKDRFRREIL